MKFHQKNSWRYGPLCWEVINLYLKSFQILTRSFQAIFKNLNNLLRKQLEGHRDVNLDVEKYVKFCYNMFSAMRYSLSVSSFSCKTLIMCSQLFHRNTTSPQPSTWQTTTFVIKLSMPLSKIRNSAISKPWHSLPTPGPTTWYPLVQMYYKLFFIIDHCTFLIIFGIVIIWIICCTYWNPFTFRARRILYEFLLECVLDTRL